MACDLQKQCCRHKIPHSPLATAGSWIAKRAPRTLLAFCLVLPELPPALSRDLSGRQARQGDGGTLGWSPRPLAPAWLAHWLPLLPWALHSPATLMTLDLEGSFLVSSCTSVLPGLTPGSHLGTPTSHRGQRPHSSESTAQGLYTQHSILWVPGPGPALLTRQDAS